MKKFFKENNLIIICIIIFLGIIGIFTGFVISKNASKNSINASSIDSLEPSYKEVEEDKPVIKENVTLEIGSELPTVTTYFEQIKNVNPESTINYYFNGIEISDSTFTTIKDDKKYLKSVNTYKVVIVDNDKEYTSELKVVDTTPPTISLKNVYITEGDKYSVKNFLSSYSDNSGSNSYSISFKNPDYANYKNTGTYTVVVTVCDQQKNCVDKNSTLTINQFELKVVKTIQQEVVIKSEEVKYGVKRITKAKVTYDVYNDGSKKEVGRTGVTTKLDQSTFNGKVSTMKSEASSLYNSLEGTRNTVLSITNGYRAEKNAEPLSLDTTLSIMATIRAMEMAYSGDFSHTRPDGREWSTMWSDYLGKMPGGISIGENLAYGYSSDENACKGWRASPGHYENMINVGFKKIGVGKYTFNGKTYWVQLFQS